MGLLSLFYKSSPAEQQVVHSSPSCSASPAKAAEEPFIDHRTWPEPALVPYRAIVVFSGCHGEVCMEPYVRRKLMLPQTVIGAIYDGDDPSKHAEPVRVLPSNETLDGRLYHLKKHTHLLRGWTRDWKEVHLINDVDVGQVGPVAPVHDVCHSKSRGDEYYSDTDSISPCGIALEDGRLFQTATWWDHFLEEGEHYAGNWEYLLESARKEFGATASKNTGTNERPQSGS